MSIPPITTDNIPLTHKRDIYSLDLPPAAISVAYEILLVIWPPLLISHYSFYYLLIIITLPIQWIKKRLTVSRCKEGTSVGNMMKKDDTKIPSSIDPRSLIKTKKFITVMFFPAIVQRLGIASWNINIVSNKYSVKCFAYLPSILYFPCWICFVLVLFLFYWSLPVIIHMSALIENLYFCSFFWLFGCML